MQQKETLKRSYEKNLTFQLYYCIFLMIRTAIVPIQSLNEFEIMFIVI